MVSREEGNFGKKKVLEDRLKKTAFRLSHKRPIADADIYIRANGGQPYVTVSFDVQDPLLKDDFSALSALDQKDGCWDEKKERLAIRNAMNGVHAGRVATKKKLLTLGSEIGVL